MFVWSKISGKPSISLTCVKRKLNALLEIICSEIKHVACPNKELKWARSNTQLTQGEKTGDYEVLDLKKLRKFMRVRINELRSLNLDVETCNSAKWHCENFVSTNLCTFNICYIELDGGKNHVKRSSVTLKKII